MPQNSSKDELFMRQALAEAKLAEMEGEIPIGAVITFNDTIIAKAHNCTENLNDVTAHAEIIAITAAENYLGAKYLNQCTLYVTMEPCGMCAGALGWAQIGKIIYGASDDKKGYHITAPHILHPKTIIESGILEDECSTIVKDFFKNKR